MIPTSLLVVFPSWSLGQASSRKPVESAKTVLVVVPRNAGPRYHFLVSRGICRLDVVLVIPALAIASSSSNRRAEGSQQGRPAVGVGAREELETCQEESPFVFRMGAEEALEAFEKALVGKRVGEPSELTIACDDAYGEETDEAVLSLPKETFMVDGKLDEEVKQAGEWYHRVTTKETKLWAWWWR